MTTSAVGRREIRQPSFLIPTPTSPPSVPFQMPPKNAGKGGGKGASATDTAANAEANASLQSAADDSHVRTGPRLTWTGPVAPASGPAVARSHNVAGMWDGRLWVIGGLCGTTSKSAVSSVGVQSYDFPTHSWTVVGVSGSPHPALTQCAGAIVDHAEHRGAMVVVGGWNGRSRVSTTSLFNLETCQWHAVPTTGDRPPPITFHTCTAVGRRLVVVGGNTVDGQTCDVFILDTASWHWNTVPSSVGAPAKRSSHTATLLHDSHIVVIGGRGAGDTTQALGDVAVFDLSGSQWLIGVRVEGQLPPRYGHSAVAVGNDIVVFGGVGDQGQLLNDVWLLNCEKPQLLTWSKAVTTPTPANTATNNAASPVLTVVPPPAAQAAPPQGVPSGRAGCTIIDAMNAVYVFGGRTDALAQRSSAELWHLDCTALTPTGCGGVTGGPASPGGHDGDNNSQDGSRTPSDN